MLVKELLRYLYYGTTLKFYEKEMLSLEHERYLCEGVYKGDNVNEFLLERKVQGYYIENNILNVVLYKESEEY